MDQGRIQTISVFFFISLAALAACKERGTGNKSSESSVVTLTGPVQSIRSYDAPDASGISGSEQDSGSMLPESFMTGLMECQKQGRYFDLQIASCTEIPLASHPCDLTVLLSESSAVLNAGQKLTLKEYVDSNLQGYSLYACTTDASQPALHFYRVDTDRIRAHNVRIENP